MTPGAASPRAPAGAAAGTRRGRRLLLWILVAAAALRIGYAAVAWMVVRDEAVFMNPDSAGYIELARSLAGGRGFASPDTPELTLIRTPGYPVLLVPGVWAGSLVPVTLAIQILLSVATVGAVYAITRLLTRSGRAALAAAAVYSVEPLSVGYSALVLSETLFTAMVSWALYLLARHLRDDERGPLLGGVLLLSLAAYVRPAGYFIPFCVLVFLALRMARGRSWRTLPSLVIPLVLVLALLLPWHLRNRGLGYSGFTAISAVNVYFYNAAAVLAEEQGIALEEQQARMGYLNEPAYLAQHPEQRAWGLGRRFEYLDEQGKSIIGSRMPTYLRLHLEGMARVVVDPGQREIFRATGLYPEQGGGLMGRVRAEGVVPAVLDFLRENFAAAAVIASLGTLLLAIYGLSVIGVVSGGMWRQGTVVLLVCGIAYFVAVGGGPVGYGRFRHPAMPLLVILAATGLVAIRRRRSRRSAVPRAPAAVVEPPGATGTAG